MSIQITQQPKAISFSRNPVVFQFKTDAQLQVTGKAFISKLLFDYYAPQNYAFTLSYGDVKLAFTITPVPDESGYQLPSRQVVNASDYAAILAEALNGNYYFGRDFIASVDNNGVDYWIKITARNNGSIYNITFTGDASMGFQTVQSGVDDVPNPNFKVYREIWVSINNAPAQKVSDAYLEAGAGGLVNMDISGQLTDAMLAGGYDRPNFDSAIAFENAVSACKFYVRYAEVYGVEQVIKRVYQTDTYFALLGGISKEMLTTIQLPDSFIANGKLKFLKQDYVEKYLLPEQAEFLSIALLDADRASVSLKFTINYDDGSALNLVKFSLANVSRYSKLTFPVGFVQNNINLLDATRAVVNYSVVLVDGEGNELSEVRTYYIDYNFRPYTRQFVYLSSLGTYDTLITFGQGSTQYDLIQSSAEIATDRGFLLADGDQINYSNSLNNTESVTSGYREKAEIRLFKDLALSVDLLLYRKKRIYPVALASKNIKEFKDAENLHAISFDFGFRYNEELYTADPADDDDTPMFLPLNFAAAPGVPAPDTSLDYRYYLKTETYNQTEVNALLQTIRNSIGTLSGKEAGDYADLLLKLADKSDVGHTHDDIYIPRAEMQDLLDQLNDVLENGVGLKPKDIGYGLKFEEEKLIVDNSVMATKISVDAIKAALSVHPTYTGPAASLSSPQSATRYEVGQSVAVTLNLAFTQNDGGAPTGYSIKKAGNPVSAGNTFTETIVMAIAAVQYQGAVTYNAGAVKNNNFGDADPVGQIAAGTANSGAINFQGYYAMRYGPVAAAVSDSAGVRGLASSQLTILGNTFTLNTGAVNRIFQFWLPTGKNLTSVVDQDALNAVVTGGYIASALSVNDAQGNPVAGTLYTMTNAVPYSTNHRHLVTVS